MLLRRLLKIYVTDATGLMMPDLRGQFVMETDASALGVGATLYQFAVDDKLLPLWFLSKKFSTAARSKL